MARRRGIFRRGRDREPDDRSDEQPDGDDETAAGEPATETGPPEPDNERRPAGPELSAPPSATDQRHEDWTPPADEGDEVAGIGPETSEWAPTPPPAPTPAPSRSTEAHPADTDEPLTEEAEERIPSEVVVAQSTAEDRFARKLAERERDLERERDEKVSAIEDSDRRLLQIEQGTIAATERLETAERVLADEAKRLKLETAAHLEAASGRAREEAQIEADRRVAEREAELDAAKAEAERLAREAEQRARAAELRARKAEEVGARTATEARVAAAEWLRGQADALRNEGERRSRADLERPEAATERVERSSASARNAPHRSREERFRAAAERLGGVAQQSEDIRPLRTRRKSERDESTAATAAPGETVTLASANFEQLRHLGLSVKQAKRLLRHRDERGLSSVGDLVGVPGFTRSVLDELESRLVD